MFGKASLKPSHWSQGGSNRVERPSPGAAIAAKAIAKLAQAGAVTNGAARRLATAMQCRMPKVMGSLGAKAKLPAVTSAAAPATIAKRRQKALTFSPLRWASASDTPTRTRNALATTCEKSRICGVNGSHGGASRKSARSQLRW